MNTRGTIRAVRARASLALALLLSLVLVWSVAPTRSGTAPVLSARSALTGALPVEAKAILSAAGALLRAPDLRQAGDADDTAPCLPVLLPDCAVRATATRAVGDGANRPARTSRPEPRAPPTA